MSLLSTSSLTRSEPATSGSLPSLRSPGRSRPEVPFDRRYPDGIAMNPKLTALMGSTDGVELEPLRPCHATRDF
jgi:hypothetical protein